MTKSNLRFYHRYYEDGSCRVICMDCYESLGTGRDRLAVTRMESEHVCSGGLHPIAGAVRVRDKLAVTPSPGPPASSSSETILMRLPLGLLLPLTAIVLYVIPTLLEIMARTQVNTWAAVILPGNALGCAVLITLLRMPRTGLILYLGLAGCECWLHVTHTMRGMTMAWIVDLVPTLVVLSLLTWRLPRARGTRLTGFC